MPWLYLVSDHAAENLAGYVASGGTVLVTFFSGIVDPCDRVRRGGYQAPWQELLGLRALEFAPLPAGRTESVVGALADPGATARRWQERIELEGAEPLLAFDSGPLRREPCLTVHEHGRGTAYYLATWLDSSTLDALVALVTRQAGVRPVLTVPPGVEAVKRAGHLFVINHGETDAVVDLGTHDRRDALSGSMVGGAATLAPGQALVLEPQPVIIEGGRAPA